MAKIINSDNNIYKEILLTILFSIINSAFLSIFHHYINYIFSVNIPKSWFDFVVGHLILSSFVMMPLIILIKRLIYNAETRVSSDAIEFLTQKLPLHLRGEVPYAIAAEGHYVRVYTALGNEMIMMKFEDAVKAMIGTKGVQTHRSWWVLSSQIQKIVPTGSSYEAQLKSGLSVPVSRRKKKNTLRSINNI